MCNINKSHGWKFVLCSMENKVREHARKLLEKRIKKPFFDVRSRICVKNLPKHVNEGRLHEFFSRKGEVTDVKLMRTRDGKTRQFAFIGFRTEKDAEEALDYFNNTYMDACKIKCEVARKVNDPNLPRPWSHYSAHKGSKLVENNNNNKKKNNKDTKSQRSATDDKDLGTRSITKKDTKDNRSTDPKLQEFLQIMQPCSKSKFWANDALVSEDGKTPDKEIELLKNKKKQITVLKSKIDGQSFEENQTNDVTSSDLHNQEHSEATKVEQPHGEIISDMEYFRSRIKKNWSDSETDDEGIEADKEDPPNEPLSKDDVKANLVDPHDPINSEQQQVKVKESPSHFSDDEHNDTDENDNTENPTSSSGDGMKQALETGRLFIRNLPYTATEDDLLAHFSQFGDVSQVHLIVDKDTKRSKGIAYVLYSVPESAVRALDELDNSIFQGRLLHILPAKPQSSTSEKLEFENNTGQGKKNFKQLRQEQRKTSEASGDTRAWNSLFMRPDTVVENIARKHGISKSDLLEREADDLAVRIALGETHVIAETKKALCSAGINAAALEEYASKKTENTKRSNHVILVKNLPYSSSEGDLANMFGKFGNLDKVILPPTRILALVIFLEAAEARAAFKGLAYKRYKDAPLYLEWAPENILLPNPAPENKEQKNVVGQEYVKKVLIEQSVEGVPEEDADPDRVESRSIFVKNLNFKTSDESLRKHFHDNMKYGALKSVKVKKHLKNGKNVSMGFGFVEFDSLETATNICKDLQGTVLDGHALILQLCHFKKSEQVLKKNEKDKSSTKLIVRNVAFEATKNDLKQLFSPFGKIKSLRLPMKFGTHRGFAFVEFVTKQEAQKALDALSSTHLYGRHLVLERAKEGETLEELRARVGAQFEQNGVAKLSKKRKQTTVLDQSDVKFARILN